MTTVLSPLMGKTWRGDIKAPDQGQAAAPIHKLLRVTLFSEVEDSYRLRLHMEKFLQDANATFPLTPIYTDGALRLSGHLGVSHAPRRSVELSGLNTELVRVESSRLPEQWRKVKSISAYRFYLVIIQLPFVPVW